ncbi:MAG: CBS domain-containing protein [Pseudomonadota bacterium]
MRNLPISKIMSNSLVTAGPDDSLRETVALMDKRRVHHLLVVDRGKLVGILSSADMLKLALLLRPEDAGGPPQLSDTLALRVRDVMQAEVVTLYENANLREAAQALSLGGYHALPVLALDDTPIGIVTSTDLIALLLDQIDWVATRAPDFSSSGQEPRDGAMARLLDVLRAAEVYLQSGQSEQQHSQLTRSVARAREVTVAKHTPLRL